MSKVKDFRLKTRLSGHLFLAIFALLFLSIAYNIQHEYKYNSRLFLQKNWDLFHRMEIDFGQQPTPWIIQRIEEQMKADFVHFYVYKRAGQIVQASQNVSEFALDLQKNIKQVRTQDSREIFHLSFGNEDLYWGYFTNTPKYFWEMLKTIAIPLFFMILGCIFAVLHILNKDIFFIEKLAQLLSSNKGKSELSAIQPLTREEMIFKGFFESAQSEILKSKLQLDLYKRGLPEGILVELLSGKTPPYRFKVTLVRMDLNEYTRMRFNISAQFIKDLLDEFFPLTKELRIRYFGYKIENPGDEEIVFFKEDDGTDSYMRALAYIRDCFRAAEILDKREKAEGRPGFVLKASLSQSDLDFEERVGEFKYDGDAFVHTARALNHVIDKTANALILCEEGPADLKKLALTDQDRRVLFKGYPFESQIWTVNRFFELSEAPSMRKYFRDDQDLEQHLEDLSQMIIRNEDAPYWALYKILSQIQLARTSLNIEKKWVQILSEVSKWTTDVRVLSSILSLTTTILPSQTVKKPMEQAIRSFLSHSDPRIQSNALCCLLHYGIQIQIEPFINSSSARLQASAICAAGKSSFDDLIYRKLETLFASANPNEVTSGLYAFDFLLKYHGTQNPTYIKSNPEILKLVDQAKSISSAHEGIQRWKHRVSETLSFYS